MCGIAGIISFGDDEAPSQRQIKAMCDTIMHRGPDDFGMSIKDGVGLGMRRLSIIDVEGGHQPIYNEDESICVVFNGEIYNFKELRRHLQDKGHHFTSSTDTEVIVHLYEEVGTEFPRFLNGMFAIALHDRRQRCCILARDHLGIKPLFFSQTENHFVFGSEIKAILASKLIHRQLDIDALGQFLAWEYVPAPSSLFSGVQKLEPGSLITIDIDRCSVRRGRFWEIPRNHAMNTNGRTAYSDSEWEDIIDDKIRECVQRQLVSDVPLGAFLSGGVDSSLIVAGMGDARTFSIGFEDPTYNEVPWSQQVAKYLGVDHTVEIIQPNVVDLFDRLMYFMDDPIGDFSIFPTFLVSQLARKHVKVALSGDGGDELFGGYETYLAEAKSRTWMRIPSVVRRRVLEPALKSIRPTSAKKGVINKAKRFIEGLEHSPRLGHARWRVFVGETMREALFTEEAKRLLTCPVDSHISSLLDQAAERPHADRALYADVRSYLVDNCLVKVDRMSMACSLETRVPFLDHELVELAFKMPAHLKYDSGQTKILLKRIACRHVPRDCVYRPKEGFSIPIKHWLRTKLRPLLDEFLAEDRLRKGGVFNPTYVQLLIREHLENRANHSHVLWSLLVFENWRERWNVAA